MSYDLDTFDSVRDMEIDIVTASPELVNKVDNAIRSVVHEFTTAPVEWYDTVIADLRDNESHQRAFLAETLLRQRMAISLLELFTHRLEDEAKIMETMFEKTRSKNE